MIWQGGSSKVGKKNYCLPSWEENNEHRKIAKEKYLSKPNSLPKPPDH